MWQMLYNFLLFLTCAGMLAYLAFHIIFRTSFNKPLQRDFRKHRVTVLILDDQEKKDPLTFLTALINQNYPQELYEIIIAGDSQGSYTAELIERFQDTGVNIRTIEITDSNADRDWCKTALEKAARVSAGELILITKAACLVPLTWISSMVEYFTEDVSIVAGHTYIGLKSSSRSSFMNKYQHFDLALKQMARAGWCSLGKIPPLACENIGLKRAAMDGPAPAGLKAVFNPDKKSFVRRAPEKSWRKILESTVTMSFNRGFPKKPDISFTLTMLLVAFPYWGGLILLFTNWLFGLGVFLLRIVLDILFIKHYGQDFYLAPQTKIIYPIWMFVQTITFPLCLIMSLINVSSGGGHLKFERIME